MHTPVPGQEKRTRSFPPMAKVAIAFGGLVVLYTVFLQSYSIPTTHMAGTIRVGQHVFGSRWYGSVQRSDILTFDRADDNDQTTYVSRCVALPGDQLEIRDRQVFVNGNRLPDPPLVQFSYVVRTQERLSPRFLDKFGITDVVEIPNGYLLHTTPKNAEALKALESIQSVSFPSANDGFEPDRCFPGSPLFQWTTDDFGPLYIPKQGDKIKLDERNVALYQYAILHYEDNGNAKVANGKLYLNDQAVTQYTFKQNYYFMMGDNRHNALDSRYWGLLPEANRKQKVVLIW